MVGLPTQAALPREASPGARLLQRLVRQRGGASPSLVLRGALKARRGTTRRALRALTDPERPVRKHALGAGLGALCRPLLRDRLEITAGYEKRHGHHEQGRERPESQARQPVTGAIQHGPSLPNGQAAQLRAPISV